MKKVTEWFNSHKKLTAAFMAVLCVVTTMAVGVSANETTSLDGFMTSVSGALSDFSTTTLSSILVKAIGLCAGLVIAWFAFRFIKGKVLGALKRGKM